MFSSPSPIIAKRVGANLVASFPKANPPLVWSFDLQRNHSFTVALQGEEGDWELGVMSPKGDFYAIARFLMREDGETALAAVQKVLMKPPSRWWRRILYFIGLPVVLIVALLLLRGALEGLDRKGFRPQTAEAPPAEIKNGVPLSADDVLKPPN